MSVSGLVDLAYIMLVTTGALVVILGIGTLALVAVGWASMWGLAGCLNLRDWLRARGGVR